MSKKGLNQYISLYITFTICLITCLIIWFSPSTTNLDGSISTYAVPNKVLFGLGGLALVFVFVLLKKPIWKYLFLLLIILSFFPILDFTTRSFSIGFGSLNLELIPLTILIAHLALNSDIFKWIKLSFLSKSEEAIEQEFSHKIEMFKERYSNKSNEELKEIIKDKNMYSEEAIEAAKQLLNNN